MPNYYALRDSFTGNWQWWNLAMAPTSDSARTVLAEYVNGVFRVVAAQGDISNNDLIKGLIRALEMWQTPRLLRQALTSSPSVDARPGPTNGMTAVQMLAYYESQIAGLRAQLTES